MLLLLPAHAYTAASSSELKVTEDRQSASGTTMCRAPAADEGLHDKLQDCPKRQTLIRLSEVIAALGVCHALIWVLLQSGLACATVLSFTLASVASKCGS